MYQIPFDGRAPPRPAGELTALPDLLAGLREPILLRESYGNWKGTEREEGGREGRR